MDASCVHFGSGGERIPPLFGSGGKNFTLRGKNPPEIYIVIPYSYVIDKLLSKLSGFPNLIILYSIFCCLAVSSASAERALSKLKIVKNRLRSTQFAL